MNILIVSTSDNRGGAAIAAYRLMNALKSEGVNIKMAVIDKRSNNSDVIQVGNKLNNRYNFYRERGEIFLINRLSKVNLFDVSIANTSTSITKLDEFKNANVIHLHWINQGILSIKEIEKILQSGKRLFGQCMICGHLRAFVIMPQVVITTKVLVDVSISCKSFRIRYF